MRTTEIQLTREQAEQFYAEKADEPYFEDLMQEMISYVQSKTKLISLLSYFQRTNSGDVFD